MKKLYIATLFVILLFNGTASGQGAIGVYFDEAATRMVTYVRYITVLRAYCVLTDLPTAGVAGFEAQITYTEPLMLTGWTYPAAAGTINLQTPPTFLAGFSTPQPAIDGSFVAVSFDVMVPTLDPRNWTFYDYDPDDIYDDACEARIGVEAVFFHSLDEAVPAYLDESGEIRPLGIAVSSQYRQQPWSTIFPWWAVATDDVTFDEVKSLYR